MMKDDNVINIEKERALLEARAKRDEELERIADIDAEIKKLEHNKANNPTEMGTLYDKRIATMVEMRKLLEKY